MKRILTIICASVSVIASAQNLKTKHFFNTNVDVQLQAHFGIGGAAPLVMPQEIRKIQSYNPTLMLGLETNATKWFGEKQKWGVRVGVRVESKGMKTRANVKNYATRIAQNNEQINGYFTGNVSTDVKNTYSTVPVSLVFKPSENWRVYASVYASGLLDGNFKGEVSDGYLRENTPVGTKILFEENGSAQYNFSNEVNQFQWGTALGGEYHFKKNLLLLAEINYGINGVLKKDFDAISFSLHNVNLNIGFGYRF